MSINTNTGVSIGVLVVMISGFLLVMQGLNGNKTETVATKMELSSQIDKLSSRVSNLESAKNSWNSTDMFKWAVHLQQANPQIKVPEPEVNTK